MKTLTVALMAILVASVIANSHAFALTQPYDAGYPNTTTITKHNQYTTKTDFSGTTTSTRDTFITSVFSSATYVSSSATSPSEWVHQQGVTLKSDNNIRGIYQTYQGITCKANCPGDVGSDLGNYGTGTADIDYVYTTFYFTGVPTSKVQFYYEPHTNSGNVVIVPIRDYVLSTYSDPSTKYAIGTFYQNINVGGVNHNTKFKLYQFGIEGSDTSGSTGGQVTQTWLVKQYALTYQGATSLSGIPATSAIGATDDNNGSYITPYTKSDGTIGRVLVGGADYTNAGASYNLNDSTVEKGRVDWKKSSTHISGGTALWS